MNKTPNGNVYALNDIDYILFSNQREYFKKINKIMIWIMAIAVSSILFVAQYVFKKSTIDVLFFALCLVFMVSFIITGYKWLSESPIHFKKEKIWLKISILIGLLMPFMKFLFTISYSYIFIPFFIYIGLIMAHEISRIKQEKSKLPIYKKYIKLFSLIAFSILLLTAFAIMKSQNFLFNTGWLFLFIAIIGTNITLFVLSKIWRRAKGKLSLPITSIRVILVGFLMGVFVWSIGVFIKHLNIGLISGAGIGIQIIISCLIVLILLKGKGDFSKNFVKGYVVNVAIFAQTLIVILIQFFQLSSGAKESSFINEILLTASVIIYYSILILKNILRSSKYDNIDTLILISTGFIMLVLAIFEWLGVTVAVREWNIDTILISVVSGITGINLLFVAKNWFGFLSPKERVRIWK